MKVLKRILIMFALGVVIFNILIFMIASSHTSYKAPTSNDRVINQIEDFQNSDEYIAATDAVNEFIDSLESIIPQDNVSEAPSINLVDETHEGYTRGAFGDSWVDVDNNSCSTRDDVLQRDLTNIILDGNCKVVEGDLVDPYSGVNLHHIYGESSIDIDHIVPLAYAWDHGAYAWSDAERIAFANDMENLLAVSASENRSKGASGPSEYMPSNNDYKCQYATNFLNIVTKYSLTMTQDDYNVAQSACS